MPIIRACCVRGDNGLKQEGVQRRGAQVLFLTYRFSAKNSAGDFCVSFPPLIAGGSRGHPQTEQALDQNAQNQGESPTVRERIDNRMEIAAGWVTF